MEPARGQRGLPRRIGTCFGPPGLERETLLYAGPMRLDGVDGEPEIVGRVVLQMEGRPRLLLYVDEAAHGAAQIEWDLRGPIDSMVFPLGGPIAGPLATSRRSDATPLLIGKTVEGGRIENADRFLFHVAGTFDGYLPVRPVHEGGAQPQLALELPGWELALTLASGPEASAFGAVVAAHPRELPATGEQVQELQQRLFVLLSLIASRERGCGAVVGMSGDDVVWMWCGAPVVRTEPSGVRWCPKHLVAPALSALAEGMGQLASDPAMEQAVARAAKFLLAADGAEALDVRIPLACAGLELLSWAVLRRRDRMGRKSYKELKDAGRARELFARASVPVGIPPEFEALRALAQSREDVVADGPGVLWSVRHDLIHPPNHAGTPAWPSSDELRESWQLGGWYLELALLWLLGYRGSYGSRLRLDRWAYEIEAVPWADA
jgi:hypothetical protein